MILRFWLISAAISSVALAEPTPLATRSGITLPPPRVVAAHLEIGGIYVPRNSQLIDHDTGMLEGSFTWNYSLFEKLGLFGRHSLAGMWWGEVSILTMGHEVGARLLLGPHLVFEVAYLGHRAEYEWLKGDPFSLGGVNDHGVEVGAWAHARFFHKLLLEGNLLFRRFDTPTGRDSASFTDQLVFGFGLRATIQILRNHEILLSSELLRAFRADYSRVGVEKITCNTVGTISWRTRFPRELALEFGLSLTTNWYTGIIPMLEIKRSMIDEPMARGFFRFYFQV